MDKGKKTPAHLAHSGVGSQFWVLKDTKKVPSKPNSHI